MPSSRAGLVVSRDSSGQFRLWEMTAGKEVPLSEKVPAELLRKRLATDGRWLVLPKEGTVVLVDGVTGEEKIDLPMKGGRFAFSVDGRSLVGITRGDFPLSRMLFWHAAGSGQPEDRETFRRGLDQDLAWRAPSGLPAPASLSADGRLLTVIPTSGVVRLLQPATPRSVNTFDSPQDSSYTHAVLSPDGSLLAAVFDGDMVRTWTLPPTRSATLSGHSWAS